MNRLTKASPTHNKTFEVSWSVIVSLCKHRWQYQKTQGHVIRLTMFAQIINKSKPYMIFQSVHSLIVIFRKTSFLIDNNLQTSLLADHWTLI